MSGDPLQVAMDAISRPKRIRGEDGREVEERAIAETAQAIALCSDLEAAADGTRQNGVVMIPKPRRL